MKSLRAVLVAVSVAGGALALAACAPHGGAHVSVGPGGVQWGAGLGVTAGSRPAHGPRPPGFCTFRDRRTGQLYYAPCR